MYRLIREAAQRFGDKAPKECILGAKVATVSIIVAATGAAIAFWVSASIGFPVAATGVIGGLCGMVVYYYGFFTKAAEDREDRKRIREKYEHPKQPWE